MSEPCPRTPHVPMRVLIVEDDAAAREALLRGITSAGVDAEVAVVCMTGCDEDMAALCKEGQPFDLVVLGTSKPVDAASLTRQARCLMHGLTRQGTFRSDEGVRGGVGSDKLAVCDGTRIIFLAVEEIHFLSAHYKQTYAYTSEDSFIVDMTLAGLEERLAPESFMRVHRSHLVNLDRIKEVQRRSGSCLIVMDDRGKTRIPVARRQARQFREAIGI
ncbi:MAG: LytTR family transcriptional regulator DNA-binding domain-containing protein [Coriobacteriia bacterium]|nr:LytTR family transcriptional regulator DNA-binding domain-containing protein [Coriobacteriia bacterium]